MNQTTENLILAAKQFSNPERRGILARLRAEDELNGAEKFVGDWRGLWLKGYPARIENEEAVVPYCEQFVVLNYKLDVN